MSRRAVPALQGTSRKAGSHENWGNFKCHKWEELLRHSHAAAGCAISKGPITATRKPAALASCARDARTTPAPFAASKTRTFSIAWPSASKRGRQFSTAAARSSSTRSAASGSGCIRAPSWMRGLANVRAEFSLTALAYNLRRALNILGVGGGHDGRGSRLRRVTRLYRRALGSWAPS